MAREVLGMVVKTDEGAIVAGTLLEPILLTNYLLPVVVATPETPANGATYYFGSLSGLLPQTTSGLARIYVPRAGTIKTVDIWTRAATAGTAEPISIYLRLNFTSDTLVQTVESATNTRRFYSTDLSVAIVAGDFLEIKMVCPTWVTKPASISMGGHIYVE